MPSHVWSSPPSGSDRKADDDWQLPRYSSVSRSDKSELVPKSPIGRQNRGIWGRYGKLVTAALAICTVVSTGFSALVLLQRPAALHLIAEHNDMPWDDWGPSLYENATTELAPPPSTPEDEYRRMIQQYLNGPPSKTFESNLRPDLKYITSFPAAGWTNDVMNYADLIHLALLTQRIPILGPFVPSHLPQEAGFVPFGDVFDVPRLSKELGVPILEWRDVKQKESRVWEVLGCWSNWLLQHPQPLTMATQHELKLDMSYTTVPENSKMFPDNQWDIHTSLHKLMQLGFPSARSLALQQRTPQPAELSQVAEPPSDQLLCFDFLYYTGVDTVFEWWNDWSPQWRFVGRHMRWAPKLEELGKSYLRRHFGVKEGEEVPPYIAVHARRGDFIGQCGEKSAEVCLPSHGQMKRRVEEMQAALLEKGIETDRVLVMSDEKDERWWEEVKGMGYTHINHTELETEKTYGLWYGAFLDAVFHSSGAAFVGTDRSTMSLVAQRRTQDWWDGPTTRLMFFE